MENLPVVVLSDMELHVCNGCGSGLAVGPEGKPTIDRKDQRSFSLRVGANNTQIVTYCEACAKKVAIFFLSAWE